MVSQDMTTFPAEKEAIYLTTLLLQNNVVASMSNKIYSHETQTLTNGTQMMTLFGTDIIINLLLHLPCTAHSYRKRTLWALSKKICWLPVNEYENTFHGHHGFVTQQITWQQWLRQTVCVDIEGGHSQVHSPYLLRRRKGHCHHTKSEITLLYIYIYR